MNRRSFAKMAWLVAVFGVTIGAATAGTTARTATAAAPATTATQPMCGSSACEIVLSCGGSVQKTTPDAEGRFTFREVPAGTCTVSVVEATTKSSSSAV